VAHSRLGTVLVRAGVLSEEESLASARFIVVDPDAPLAHRLGLTAAQMAEALASELGLPLVHPSLIQPKRDVIEALPEELARRTRVLPVLLVRRAEKVTLWVAMEDPTDHGALEECSVAAGAVTRPMVTSGEELRGSYHRWYGGPAPKPAPPPPAPPRRAKSVLELDITELEEAEETNPNKIPTERPKRNPYVVVVQATPALVTACRGAFSDDSVEIKEADLLDASRVVREVGPFAIVVPDDVYLFDPTAFCTLALSARALLVTTRDDDATHLEPILKTGHRTVFG
jgi:hypothetical protein